MEERVWTHIVDTFVNAQTSGKETRVSLMWMSVKGSKMSLISVVKMELRASIYQVKSGLIMSTFVQS